jgi:hypothetical protein
VLFHVTHHDARLGLELAAVRGPLSWAGARPSILAARRLLCIDGIGPKT